MGKIIKQFQFHADEAEGTASYIIKAKVFSYQSKSIKELFNILIDFNIDICQGMYSTPNGSSTGKFVVVERALPKHY